MSTARVDFTRGAAERIARVVRLVEQGERDLSGPSYGKVVESAAGSGIRLGTFSGGWAKDSAKMVTLLGSTVTFTVLNVTLPLDMDDQSPNAASRRVLFARAAGVNHAVEIEQGGICGKWQKYLITLTASNCSGSGAIAIVRSVNIGTTPQPPSNSGSGPISSLDLVSKGANYAVLGREEPAIGVSASSTMVSFSVAMSKQTGDCNVPWWKVSSVTPSGSTAFWEPQTLSVAPLNSATEVVPAVLTLDATGVKIAEAGKYYRESKSLQPYTFGVTINVSELSPSFGSGAKFSSTVDTNPSSPSFGQITGITLTDGGDDYIAWTWDGSIPFGNVDLGTLPGFKSYETQLLGHDDQSCLKWFDVSSCGTATASPY